MRAVLIDLSILKRMSFFRSDDMQSYRLVMPRDSAWDIINLLGKHNLIHIVPNSNVQTIRPFVSQVKRCEESLAKIKTIEKKMQDNNIGHKREYLTKEESQTLNELWEKHEKTGGNEETRLIQIQEAVNHIFRYTQTVANRKAQIKEKLLNLRQNIAVVKAGEREYGKTYFSLNTNKNGEGNQLQMKTLVVEGKNAESAKRTLNRITRGNSFINEVKYDKLFRTLYKGEQQKSVIFIIYPAKKYSILDKKVIRVIENYCKNWQQYSVPQNEGTQFQTKMSLLERNYVQTQKVLQFTEQQQINYLANLQDKVQGKSIKMLEYYKFYLMKQRQIYSQMNEMKTHSNFVHGEVFIRREDTEQVLQILHKVGLQTKTPIGRIVHQDYGKMPTHFRLNDFKMPAQQIVNTYGVPKYKQANPSYFALITFPFLFGVMFGDIAHGSILFLFGIFLLNQSQNSTNSIIRAMYPYRYLVALMGFFATYCGFIYNDFLSISLNLFGSCFNIEAGIPERPLHKISPNCIYPIGVDPAWAIASNNLNYINSLKMKISVIIAVTHMTLGVFVKASNALYFKKKLDFWFEFVPQLIFMVALFGYMDILIITKWLTEWKLYDASAPSIITSMINMPLKLGKTDICCGGQPMWGKHGTTSQDGIQFFLLILAVLCIPVILFPKPIIEILTIKKHKEQEQIQIKKFQSERLIAQNQQIQMAANTSSVTSKRIQSFKVIQKPKQQQSHDAGQIFVHQLIETIQYVLGCISNTASYLRLWALSLAHSQLSEVFFQKTVQGGMVKGLSGVPMMIFAFPILAGATFGVLLCMDSMQCFLHTLRLHWVQFQSKFYKGDGFLFQPVSFNRVIQQHLKKMA